MDNRKDVMMVMSLDNLTDQQMEYKLECRLVLKKVR